VRRGTRAFVGALGAVLAVSLLGAASASATFHLVKIREISPGTDTQDDSYVEVQMFAGFQNFLSGGAALKVCDPDCSPITTLSSFTDVAHGETQDTVVFGDTGVPTGSRDFVVDNLDLDQIKGGGAVCYQGEFGSNDCVSWGNFTAGSTLTGLDGASGNTGIPSPPLTSGMALRRSIAAGCPTLLEAGDDTNDSSSDFQPATPDPRPNSAAPTETPCSTGGGPAGAPTPTPSPHAKKKCKKKHKRSAAAAKKCKKRK
jgi:hypothetical protein